MHSDKTHIYMIGAGAIGKALAVFLRLAGRDVTLVRGSVNEGRELTDRIRVEMQDGRVHEADITITTLHALPALNGIVVVASKSFGNEQLATSLKGRIGNSPVVLLQNGLGVERPFLDHGFPEIYRCVLFVTSQVMDDKTVRFKPVATCPTGVERGNANRLHNIVRQLNTPQFAFKSDANIQQVIWKKAIVNCAFNSICPLLEADNGIFYRDKNAFELASRIISECLIIANGMGINLTQSGVEESLLQISKSSDGQLISTLQDIRHHRRTEIDTLNFEVVRIAESMDLATSVQETKLLGELTRLKADLSCRSGHVGPLSVS